MFCFKEGKIEKGGLFVSPTSPQLYVVLQPEDWWLKS
jgi:hypothetical protein